MPAKPNKLLCTVAWQRAAAQGAGSQRGPAKGQAGGVSGSASGAGKEASSTPSPGPSSSSTTPAVRCVVQRCTQASLLVDNAEHYESVGRGMIVHVSFLKGCTAAVVPRLVKQLLTVKLMAFPVDGIKPTSVVEAATKGGWTPCVLIVPQACLSGRAKGKQMQYHDQVPKEEGAALYAAFTEQMRAQADKLCGLNDASAAAAAAHRPQVVAGTYGNRQALRFESQGPMSHYLEM